MATCKATLKSGLPCTYRAKIGCEFCGVHLRSQARRQAKGEPKVNVFDELVRFYMDAAQQPMTRRTLLLKFHPDKLPNEIKTKMQTDKSVNTFVNRVFTDLNEKPKVTTPQELRDVLEKNKNILSGK